MKFRRYLWLILAIAILDQMVKIFVKLTMFPGEWWPAGGKVFRFTFVENNGFAFGLTLNDVMAGTGLDWTSEMAKLWLSIISLLALAALFYSLWRFATHKSPLPWFLAVVIGGALGNVIDRMFYGVWFHSMNIYPGGFMHGRVVDMFYFDPAPDLFSAPIFNIADVAIAIGVITLLIFQGRFQHLHRQRVAASLSDDLSPISGTEETSGKSHPVA